ncbi:hypothetical protein C2845_PM10G10690 [Panicum miliaceum]|uniref:Uncharacterized protein n=1 Tax=Panicum miliaceum TaxID=4540 RepID=A0A3L6PF30_PANMI|nr:hypothetical protein C2845_PM10G10690 [Panicum miliaceum]
MPRREDEDDDESLLPLPQIPDAPAYPSRQLSLLYWTLKDGDEVSEGVKRNFLWNLESSAFVPSTFWQLEECYLRAPLADLGFRRVRAVGLLAPDADAAGNQGGETAAAAADLCAWLDRFADDDSVVYIKGFEERIAAAGGRCRVIHGWAPQVAVLRHRAVGWFVTHFKWNSVLEACAAGVAMLVWPMIADQFVNARLLVDEAGAAVPVSWGGLTAAPAADEVTRVLDAAVGGKLGHVAARVVGAGGAGARAALARRNFDI